MMADAACSVAKIASIALQIKRAVETVQQNRGHCVKIEKRVSRLHGILLWLGRTEEVMRHPAMRATLEDLEETLGHALKLVTVCQERTWIVHLLRAKRLSQDLHRVNQDISDRMMDGIFATCVQVTIRLVHAMPHEDAVVGEGSNIDTLEPDSINYIVEINIEEDQGSDAAHISTRFTIFSFTELELATNNFSEERVITRGGHATVYKGVLPDGLVVAIKRFDDPVTHSLRQYVHVSSALIRHGNIVQFLGYCPESKHEMVVEEYMPNGPLSEIIHGLSQLIDWSSMLRIIRGVAEGIAHLHVNHVIHLNLNPTNIVFDSEIKPKIGEFERCTVLDQDDIQKVTEDLVGIMGYMSPEYIADGIISMKCDVFSFGAIILFMISQMEKAVLDQHPIVWAWKARETETTNELFNPSLTDESDLKDIERCMKIGLLCTQEFPGDRPSMQDVLKALNSKEDLPTPNRPSFLKDRA